MELESSYKARNKYILESGSLDFSIVLKDMFIHEIIFSFLLIAEG